MKMEMIAVPKFLPWYKTNLSPLDTAIYNYVCYGSEDNGKRANYLAEFAIPKKYQVCSSPNLYRHEFFSTKQLTTLETSPIKIGNNRIVLAYTTKRVIHDLKSNFLIKKDSNKLEVFLNIPVWFEHIRNNLVIPEIDKKHKIWFKTLDKLESLINNEQEILVYNTLYSTTISSEDEDN
jgi:hypothetical protein